MLSKPSFSFSLQDTEIDQCQHLLNSYTLKQYHRKSMLIYLNLYRVLKIKFVQIHSCHVRRQSRLGGLTVLQQFVLSNSYGEMMIEDIQLLYLQNQQQRKNWLSVYKFLNKYPNRRCTYNVATGNIKLLATSKRPEYYNRSNMFLRSGI